jgi:hypothetical protein
MKSAKPGKLAHLRTNAVAYLALFIALGGTGAYAANQMLPKGSVGAKQLKAGAVTAKKLRSGAVNGAVVADGSLGAQDLAPGVITRGADLSPYYDKQQAEERFLDGAEADAAYLDSSEADAAYLDRNEGDAAYLDDAEAQAAFLDQSEGDAAYLDQVEGDARYYTRTAADARFARGRTIRASYRIVSNNSEGQLINIAGHGSLRASCERTPTDTATIYWQPDPAFGGDSRIWMEGGNGAGLTQFVKSPVDTPRASMQLSHDDRGTVEVAGAGGLSELTVISDLSAGQIGGGYCEFFIHGSIAPASD